MASVRLDNLRKVYPDGRVAVAGVSLDIADGERVVLVGPSGCGKTSLLRMIAGLEPISAGTVRIDGRVVNEVAPKDRDIAMVFQNFALYPHMTVAQNLGFGLRLRGLRRAEVTRRVGEVATLLDLVERLDARPAALSGGQRQRVALGRALLREPKVFLLDEPLSSLDARLRQAMRAQIAALHQRLGSTMIYVTHDQTEAMTLGQRIVVLDRGQVQQIDTPMALYERPANLFVAGFFGHPGMNLLPGVVAADGAFDLGDGAGALALPPAWRESQGRQLVLGVRPEHLRIDPAGPLRAQVGWTEPLGNESLLHVHHRDTPLVVRVPPEVSPAPGSPLGLSFDPAQAHLFDAANGARVEPARGGSAVDA